MPLQPLTHHEIVSLVAPFSARGRHVDLAASNRIERRLAFRPIEHASQSPDVPALRETLGLECFPDANYRLTRVLHDPATGLEASLRIDGEDLPELLAHVDAVDPGSQFQRGAAFVIGLDYCLEPVGGQMRQVLTRGEARVDGLTLVLRPSNIGGMPADLELSAPASDGLELPEDLLAVLGWAWRRLVPKGDGWRSLLKLRRGEPARSRDAERKLRLAAEHLARTLAESPQNFHERLLRARWGVTFRRALPLLASAGLLATVPLLRYLDVADDSPLHMLMFHMPALLLVLFFSLPEIPRIEIPPLPRRPVTRSWRTALAEDQAGGAA
jgi:hypothetical protein